MQNQTTTTLPTANPDWGFWGTSRQNGYDPQLTWDAASNTIAAMFKLQPEAVRDLLDASLGRHLADELSRIPGGPASHAVTAEYLRQRLAEPGWQRWVKRSLREIKRG